jgi:hypothetical protein
MGLILHHPDMQNILRDKPKPMMEHMCEYTLLVDKIKDPSAFFHLWSLATAHNYHDFSPMFLNDNIVGQGIMMKMLDTQEKTCYLAANVTDCMQFRRLRKRRNLSVSEEVYQGKVINGDRAQTPDPGYAAYFN